MQAKEFRITWLGFVAAGLFLFLDFFLHSFHNFYFEVTHPLAGLGLILYGFYLHQKKDQSKKKSN